MIRKRLRAWYNQSTLAERLVVLVAAHIGYAMLIPASPVTVLKAAAIITVASLALPIPEHRVPERFRKQHQNGTQR